MIKEITGDELKARLNAGEQLMIVDVRQPEEREEINIPSSILIPLGELEERIDEIEDHREKEIIVYCRSGNRSANACMFLQMMGFENPVNLKGGMLAW